jgi:ABC-2 type transport system permease protein
MIAAAPTVFLKKVLSTNQMIVQTTLRRMVRGAILFAIFASAMVAMQGFAMAKTYPDMAARARFAATLSTIPQLGVLYGEQVEVATPAGYTIYRTAAFVSFIGAIWGLLVTTKMLRGQEEDGAWEILLSGQTSARRAAANTLFGLFLGALVAYGVAVILVGLTGSSSDINLSFGRCLFVALAVVAPAACFMGVGALTSQFAATRRRAVLYGLVPLVVLFALRSVGNVVPSVSWLKYLTPFGWIDKLHIVAGVQPQWFLPFIPLTGVLVALGMWLAGRRDLGESVIADSSVARPHYMLLHRLWTFSFRLMRVNLLSWLLSSIMLVALMTSLAKAATKAASESNTLTDALHSLSGGSQNTLGLAFMGAGTLFMAVLLMIMMATGVGAARDEEARGYLDNILVRPVSRSRWLVGRLLLLGVATGVICTVAAIVSWAVARNQGLQVAAGTMIIGNLSLLGSVLFLLGCGTLLYGLKPRIAVPSMYLLLLWSFTIDLLGSVVSLNHLITNSSLLHYVALVPAAQPDWKAAWILGVTGVALATLGVFAFNRRDLEAA